MSCAAPSQELVDLRLRTCMTLVLGYAMRWGGAAVWTVGAAFLRRWPLIVAGFAAWLVGQAVPDVPPPARIPLVDLREVPDVSRS